MRSQLSPVLFLKNLSFYPLLTDNGRKLKKTVAKTHCFPTFWLYYIFSERNTYENRKRKQ